MKNGSRAKMNFLLSYQKNYERTEVYIKKKEKRRSEYIKKTKDTPDLGQQDLVSSTGTYWYIYTTRYLTKRRKKSGEAMIWDDILL